MQIEPRKGAGLVLVRDMQLVTLDEIDVVPRVEGHLTTAQTKLPSRVGRRSELIVEPQPSRTRLVGLIRQLQINALGIGVVNDGDGIEVLSGLYGIDARRERRAIFLRIRDLPELGLRGKVDAEKLRLIRIRRPGLR